jgi:ADP-dependent NAD(P)H-hydrate dehydratase / NAD(P)H-hydrate epimerase
MIPLYTAEQVRSIDERAIRDLGYPSIVLMENAARSIYRLVGERYVDYGGAPVGFLCGKGNNGGDGFALARHARVNGFPVVVVMFGEEDDLSEDARVNYRILRNLAEDDPDVTIKRHQSAADLRPLKRCGMIFDAMLGTGAKGALREPYKSVVETVNKLAAVKVAVDSPTGLDVDLGSGDAIFKADFTVTLGGLKRGLFFADGFANAGEVVKGGIGVSDELFEKFDVEDHLIEPEDVLFALPEKAPDIHKYRAGKALTIAGSAQYPGAAILTASATLRAGAGATVLAFPKSAPHPSAGSYPELVVERYDDGGAGYPTPEAYDKLRERVVWADAVALGPGIGRAEETAEFVTRYLNDERRPFTVLDADGLFPLNDGAYRDVNLKNVALTPHYGEFARLLGADLDDLKKDLLDAGREFVKETGANLILKGPRTIVFQPSGESLINPVGNSGMAKFGMGDVLTGAIAGFAAQCEYQEDAMMIGVYLHSLAGDLLRGRRSEFGFSASEVVEALPDALLFLRDSVENDGKL